MTRLPFIERALSFRRRGIVRTASRAPLCREAKLSANRSSRGYALLVLIMGAAGCGEGGSPAPVSANTGNVEPIVTGSPAMTTDTGTRYSFVPAVHDPDGDALSFSIRNKPLWAGFDSQTGELSGTPQDRDVGMTHGVEISVTDGSATAILPSFNIEVLSVERKSVTVSWLPPTTNADGTPLFDLAGFRIYYGNRNGDFPFVLEVDNPGLTTLVVEDLIPGTYFFASTALDGSGNESPMSDVIEVTI